MKGNLLAGLFVGMFIAMLLHGLAWYRLLRYLKKEHPSVWAGLGSPTFFLNNSIQNSWLSLRFVLGRKYEMLGDPLAARMGQRALKAWILFMILFVAFFVVGLLLKHSA